jgi:hypothetical protein
MWEDRYALHLLLTAALDKSWGWLLTASLRIVFILIASFHTVFR